MYFAFSKSVRSNWVKSISHSRIRLFIFGIIFSGDKITLINGIIKAILKTSKKTVIKEQNIKKMKKYLYFLDNIE